MCLVFCIPYLKEVILLQFLLVFNYFQLIVSCIICVISFSICVDSKCTKKNVNKSCKKGKLTPSVWLGTNLLKFTTLFNGNIWKI